MAILRVARLGHPVLRQRASDVDVEDIKAGKFRRIVHDMIETMHEYHGVGLAGPQVHIPLRIFVCEVTDAGAGELPTPAETSARATDATVIASRQLTKQGKALVRQRWPPNHNGTTRQIRHWLSVSGMIKY